MRIRFWGTRGSIATPGPATLRHGGNTSCIELRSSRGTLLVLDCGTGARALGHSLMEETDAPRRGRLLITHTHWDHIQGFPFFEPFFQAGQRWDIYAPRDFGSSIREALAGQMQDRYFPIAPENFEAEIAYHDLNEGDFEIDDIRVKARYLNHPAVTLGYRIEADGVTVVYATDHEPYGSQLAHGSTPHTTADDDAHARFINGADLLIHDAQYTEAEYAERVGWGHSSTAFVVDAAAAAGVRRVALFHHDPARSDDALDDLVAEVRSRPSCANTALEVSAAAEGDCFDLRARPAHPAARTDAARSAEPAFDAAASPTLPLRRPVLLGIERPGLAETIAQGLRSDRLKVEITRGPSALRQAAAESDPSLVILERRLGGEDALEICQSLRDPGAGLAPGTPVIVIAENQGDVDLKGGEAAGVSDWLVPPFKSAYLRARVRCCLMRRACRWIPAPEPIDEHARLASLHALGVLDSEPEERFDRLTRIAAALFDVPVALVSLVDSDRQWFKSHYGLDATETPREMAFCSHAILSDLPMVVDDADEDGRFADNPLVTGPPHVRFYAGAPLRLDDGSRVGTLCLIDSRPRTISQSQLELLGDLAQLTRHELQRVPGNART